MEGNEVLLAARAEIEEILRKRDIAGHVVLYMPGFVEIFSHYEPSFSKLKMVHINEHEFELRIQSKLADYNGNVEAQRRDLNATAGMLSSIAQILAGDAITLMNASTYVDQKLHATHTEFRPVHQYKPGRTN